MPVKWNTFEEGVFGTSLVQIVQKNNISTTLLHTDTTRKRHI